MTRTRISGHIAIVTAVVVAVVASVITALFAADPATAATKTATAGHAASPGSATVRVGGRPASVPSGYVVTPEGYFDPHCVYQVNENQVLTPSGSGMALVTIPPAAVARARTLTVRPASPQRTQVAYKVTAAQLAAAPKVPACARPHYTLAGRPVSPAARLDSAPPPTINGYVESGTATLGAMSYLHAQWNVPAAPSNKGSQTVFFFPGFENLSGAATIIMQPVLGWNAGGGIPGWSGASWNCCSVGNAYHSAFIPVTGSTISGDVGGTGCNASTGVCSNWQIVTYDHGSSRSTTFNTNAGGRKMDWTFGGALEVYSLSSCNQYPAGTTTTFSDFYLNNINGTHVATPSWTHNTAAAGTTPACGYSITGGTNLALKY